MDIVFIEQLSVITTIGVYDWEQTIEQKLVFDIEMAWDNRKAAKSDDVADCLSYADIAETVVSHVEGARFALVERVAEEVAELLANALEIFRGIHTCARNFLGDSNVDFFAVPQNTKLL